MVRHSKDTADKARPRQGEKPFGDKKPGFKPGGPKGAKGPKEEAKPERTERIAKVMARAGIASRREVERLIGLGKVALNGRILDTPATLVKKDDVITVDGKPIGRAEATRVWRYHKPVGLLTSHKDPAGRPTVFDSLPSFLPRVISVGRLDINTEGLLLLTNDGELSRALELPATAWVRQYRARARGRVTQEQLDGLKDGVTVDGVRYGPIEAKLDKAKETDGDGERGGANLWISVSITEGKNREVRKVLESLGLQVNRLIRLAYGPFNLGTLPAGEVEEVGPRVIREMLADHVAPENMPTGNTVATPAPSAAVRRGPIVRGKSGSAMSDPSRKPSRVRAAETATAEATERQKKKPGWAKAAPRPDRPKRTFKPRDDAEGSDRPKRDFKPRAGAARREDGDRPQGAFRTREDARKRTDSDRPKRDFKPRADGDRPQRDFKPRGEGRPSGGKPGGFKAGGKPGGFKGGGGKPGGPARGGPRKPR